MVSRTPRAVCRRSRYLHDVHDKMCTPVFLTHGLSSLMRGALVEHKKQPSWCDADGTPDAVPPPRKWPRSGHPRKSTLISAETSESNLFRSCGSFHTYPWGLPPLHLPATPGQGLSHSLGDSPPRPDPLWDGPSADSRSSPGDAGRGGGVFVLGWPEVGEVRAGGCPLGT